VISFKHALRVGLIAIAGALYLGLSHLAAASEHPPLIALIVSLLPLAAIALAAAWNSRTPALAILFFVACALAFAANIDNLRSHTAWLYFVQHAGAMALLTVTFGSTLGQGHRQALCSRIACFIMHEQADADYLRYTWKVTVAWTIYFLTSAIVSVLLFSFGPIDVWSFFANILTPLLLGVMFAGEYLIRLRTMPGRTHFGISETIRAYRNYSRRR
jgi:uncharacterized membrane protein